MRFNKFNQWFFFGDALNWITYSMMDVPIGASVFARLPQNRCWWRSPHVLRLFGKKKDNQFHWFSQWTRSRLEFSPTRSYESSPFRFQRPSEYDPWDGGVYGHPPWRGHRRCLELAVRTPLIYCYGIHLHQAAKRGHRRGHRRGFDLELVRAVIGLTNY